MSMTTSAFRRKSVSGYASYQANKADAFDDDDVEHVRDLLEPERLNPLAVAAMRDAGIDIGKNTTQSVFHLYEEARLPGTSREPERRDALRGPSVSC
jgi:hypothetical protein